MVDTPISPVITEEPLSPISDGGAVVPALPIVQAQAQRHDYALGDRSPGVEQITTQIASGGEQDLRDQAAADEDARTAEERKNLISLIAKNAGGQLTPDDMKLVQHIATSSFKTDPSTVLEKKFGTRLVNDLATSRTQDINRQSPASQEVEDIAAEHFKDREWHQNEYHKLDQEWNDTGWVTGTGGLGWAQGGLGKLYDTAEHLVTGLPAWYRLRHALSQRPGVEFLLGSTLEQNVQYLWSLPSDQRRAQFKAAIDYLKPRSMTDAMTLAQAMVSFPSSEQFQANFITAGDYTMIGSMMVKAATRLTKATGLLKAGEAAAVPAGPKMGDPNFIGPYGEWKTPEVKGPYPVDVVSPYRGPWADGVKGSDEFTTTHRATQPDLFGGPSEIPEDPKQLELFGKSPSGDGTSIGPGDERVNSNLMVRNPADQSIFRYFRLGQPKLIRGSMTPANIRDSLHPNDVSIPHTNSSNEPGPITRFRGSTGQMGKELLGGTTENMRQTELALPPGVPQQMELNLNPVSTDPSKGLRVVMAAAMKASHGVLPDPEHVLAAVGNIEASGTMGMVRRLTGKLTGKLEDVANSLPTFAAPHEFYQDSKYIAREYGTRLAAAAKEASKSLVDAASDALRVPRLTAEQLAVGKQQATKALENEYGKRPNFSDHLINVNYIPAEAHFSGNDTMVYRLGESKGTGFTGTAAEARAKMFQRDVFHLGDEEAYITREGDSFFVDIPKHIDETTDQIRATATPKNTAPVGMLNAALRWMKSTDDLIAPFQRSNRKIAQHAVQGVRGIAKDLEDNVILGMPKAERKDLFSFLEMQRDQPQAANPSKRGVWSQTAGEFEQQFIEKYGHPPTAEQTHGYDTYRRLNDFDWMLRNSALYRDKARQGVETYRIRTTDGYTNWFDAKPHDSFPWEIGKKDQHDAGIYVHDQETGTGKYYYKFDITPDEKQEIDKLVEGGYKVIQIHDPKKHPLEGFAKTASGSDLKDQVNYVVTNASDKKPLSWNQLDYNPGAHVIYPHKWYVSIPLVGTGRKGKLTYYGDNVALNVSSEASAKKWAERIDTARQMARLGDPNLSVYVQTHLPMTMEQFTQGWLKNGAQFSLDHPVVYKEAGHNTLETLPYYKKMLAKDDIVDSTRNPHDLSNWLDNAFVQDRDLVLNTVDETGTRLVPAEQLDPYAALHRALNQSLRNVWMNDYKISAMEQFFQQFGHLMKPPSHTLTSFPTFFLHNPQWSNVASNQWAELGAAKATQKAIVNFMGAQSEVGSAMKAYETQVQNLVFKLFGEKAAGKLDTSVALGAIKDPFQFMRAYAYHSVLGMFNPGQLLTQMAQMNHAIAVTGVENGLAGISAAWGMRMLHANPAHIDAVASMMTKFGWKEAEFKEMWALTQNSGVARVAGEAVMRDELDPPMFRSKLGHILFDIGPMFFNEGERMSRFTGVAAAYRQLVRGELKGKPIGSREAAQIIDRADLLTGNMTRASAAGWQSGIAAVPTQFFAWQARMVEQMTGGLVHDVTGGRLGNAGRLTGVEKARALATYSVLFGAPIGLSPLVGGFPLYDSLQKEASKRGIDLSPKWLEFITDGLYSTAFHMATGKAYNIPQKFGPGNNQALSDILLGDKSVPEVLGGASGTAIAGIVKSMAPFYYSAASAFYDVGEYKLMPSDFMQMLQTIKTADTAVKAYAAATYGKWLTRNGANVTDADSMDAAMAVLGLTPKDATDTFLRLKAGKELTKTYETFENQAYEDYRMGSQAIQDKDFDKASHYMTRANTALALGEVPWERRNKLFHRATTEMGNLRQNANWHLYMNSRTGSQDKALQYYQQNYKDQ